MRAHKRRKRYFGIVGGLGALAGADVFFKLIKSTPASSDQEHFDVVLEQHPFDGDGRPGDEHTVPSARKLHVFNIIKGFEQRRVDSVILPCFISHSFLDELREEISLPIIDVMEALRWWIQRHHPHAKQLGVLTSSYLRNRGLFEKYFGPDYQLVYPRPATQENSLMQAVYGPRGIKAGHLQGESIALLDHACHDVIEQGAQIVVPGITEIPVVIGSLNNHGVPIVDSNLVYVQYAIAHEANALRKAFKLGIVGGIGPAATVDFIDKIVNNTDARRDQEHIRLVVEHNPQIPDRTENLVGGGPDPTIALYAACKKLEASDADLIAIPCNTGHAYIERIQPYLSIPIVNMLFETLEYITNHYPHAKTIGLLATTGTVKSRVYHDIIEKTDLQLLTPDDDRQQKVMNAIYGECGIKAGYREGVCREQLMDALHHLVQRGAELIVLGCTELPLLLSQMESFPVAGKNVVILDPAEVLARKCVRLSLDAACFAGGR